MENLPGYRLFDRRVNHDQLGVLSGFPSYIYLCTYMHISFLVWRVFSPCRSSWPSVRCATCRGFTTSLQLRLDVSTQETAPFFLGSIQLDLGFPSSSQFIDIYRCFFLMIFASIFTINNIRRLYSKQTMTVFFRDWRLHMLAAEFVFAQTVWFRVRFSPWQGWCGPGQSSSDSWFNLAP